MVPWNNERVMMKGKNIFLLGSIVLIVLAIGLVALLDRIGSPSDSSDIRARAATINTLKLNGTVSKIDEAKGILTVDDVYFAEISRSGEAKHLGTWTVTAPGTFNISSTPPGTNIVIGVDPASFVITSHTMNALTITPGVK
jgi:hypothetical protein